MNKSVLLIVETQTSTTTRTMPTTTTYLGRLLHVPQTKYTLSMLSFVSLGSTCWCPYTPFMHF